MQRRITSKHLRKLRLRDFGARKQKWFFKYNVHAWAHGCSVGLELLRSKIQWAHHVRARGHREHFYFCGRVRRCFHNERQKRRREHEP